MTIEERRRRLLALDPLEELLKQRYEIVTDSALSDTQKRERIRKARRRLRERLQDDGDPLREYMQLRDPEGSARVQTDPLELAPLKEDYHISQNRYGLEGNRHVQISTAMRYLPGGRHDHAFIELAYVMQGTATHRFYLRGSVTESHMREGSVLIIPPGQEHQVEILDDSRMINILIRTETFQDVFLSKLPDQNRIYDFFARVCSKRNAPGFILVHTKDRGELDETLLSMMSALEQEGIYTDAIVDNLMENWFLYMLTYQTEIEQHQETAKGTMDVTVLSVLMYIETHYAETSLADIRQRYHFSPSYLNRIFKKETGTTIQQHILDVRMEHARRLLEETDIPIAAAGEAVGYEDPAYFTTSFRRKYGISPQKYRDSLKN